MPVINNLPSGGIPKMKLLWSGDFSGSGSITVQGISEWGLVAYVNYDNETYLLIGNPTRGGSLYGSYDSASIATCAYRFGISGDTITVDKSDRGIYFDNSTTYSSGANCHVKKIYGIVKKP